MADEGHEAPPRGENKMESGEKEFLNGSNGLHTNVMNGSQIEVKIVTNDTQVNEGSESR